MAARLNLLSDTECRNGTSEGRAIRKLHDGGGLYLWIYQDGSRFWRLRYWIDGKKKSLSFGSYPDITLKETRSKRDTERRMTGHGFRSVASTALNEMGFRADVVESQGKNFAIQGGLTRILQT